MRMRIDHPLGNQPPPVIPRGGRPLRHYRHTGEGRYPGTMREGRQLSNIAISPPSQPSLSRGNRLRKNLRKRESTDAMKRKCGQTRQSNSDTTARPMRHVSDTKKLLSATPMSQMSHPSDTKKLSRRYDRCAISATGLPPKRHKCRTTPAAGAP